MIKKLLIVLFTAPVVFIASAQKEQVTHRVTVVFSKVSIQGTTNVSEFTCELVRQGIIDQLPVKSLWHEGTITFEGLVLKYRVDEFDCGLEMMNKDFRQILKASESPYLYLTINSITLKKGVDQEIENLQVQSDVVIELAGRRKRHLVEEGTVINRSESELSLLGEDVVLMSSFDIEPPSRFFGMVSARDELIIRFRIDLIVKTEK